MWYRCPVCGFTIDADDGLARHMATTLNLHDHHLEWIESWGIDPKKDMDWVYGRMGAKHYEVLRKIIKGKCRIRA